MTKANALEMVQDDNIQETEWLDTEPNEDIEGSPDDMFFKVTRGKSTADENKWVYIVALKQGNEGKPHESEVKASPAAAFNGVLSRYGYAKGVVTPSTLKLRDLFPAAIGDNEPPEEVLDADDLKAADTLVEDIIAATNERADAEVKTRDAYLKEAVSIASLRAKFSSKKRWQAVKAEKLSKITDDSVRAVLTNNRTVGVNVNFAKASEHAAFFAAMPDSYKTPRSFEKEVGIIRATVAQAVIAGIREETKITVDKKKVWAFEKPLKSMSLDDATRLLLADFSDNGVAMPEAKSQFEEAAQVLCGIHYAAMKDVDIFTISKDAHGLVTVDVKEDSARSIFGIEGVDEMAKAIAKAANGYEKSKTIEAASSEDSAEGAKALSKTIQEGNAFSGMSTEEAARHLLHILCGKIEGEDGTAEEAQAVVSLMADRLALYEDGKLNKQDLFTAPTPDEGETEEEAEAAADAA